MARPSTARSRLVVIDTCVILEAHRLDVWHAVTSQWQVIIPEGVAGEALRVAREFDDIHLRLETEIEEGLVTSPSLPASDLRVVLAACPQFPGVIDAGEMECLAQLLKDTTGKSLVCSSDAVVFRFLGWIQQQERGISLEEILRQINLGTPVEHKLSKEFRDRWTKKGFAEAFQRGFIKP
jgi:hypothetical protein